MHVPSSCLDYFELSDVKNNTGNWELLLEEKVDLIPQALSKQLVVLGGFHNDLNVLSHSFSLKPIYLVIRRRRWKPKEGGRHYSNQYNFHSDGAKRTQEFVVF
ncbi:MAG: hypothetical protein ACJATI_003499 [Halioglobus sp.]|jgi:hypothetical protein